ncbi:P-type conjugative transfer protein TrbG [Succinimonas amylolytica]|uniref:P-type conjugative transfer protein TrbG n=1 Tax=Succinimonas amylolytica TaxID=83769 RepID=UPI000380E633|nr:P-type conjugative transfer protein TrbG [Succinimonas amylolytica]
MKKMLLPLLMLAVPAASAWALDDMDYYVGDAPEIELTDNEIKALALSQKIETRAGIPPSEGENGYVVYVYGAQKTSVVCALLRVCDIALQPGEVVSSIYLGDSARWETEPAIVGEGYSAVEHVLFKPLDVGLKTNMVLTTNRRIYHINLVSTRSDYMPQVSFVYPEEALAKFMAKKEAKTAERERNTLPSGDYLANLDFEYQIEGDHVSWSPARVYNDGRKTVIEMPKEVAVSEAPAFLVTRFSKDSSNVDQLVNYRMSEGRYIIDAVFYEGELIAGVGSDQKKVMIRRTKP